MQAIPSTHIRKANAVLVTNNYYMGSKQKTKEKSLNSSRLLLLCWIAPCCQRLLFKLLEPIHLSLKSWIRPKS
jgi:hypothetical protein